MSRTGFVVRSTNPAVFGVSYGVSESAVELRKETEELKEHFAESITFGEQLSKMLEGLLKAKEMHSMDNWDGYGARAVDGQAYGNAVRFALSLPSDVPNPEIGVDPDGEVVFEWYEGRRQVFSVSVGSRSELTYAGLYGINKSWGVEYFQEDIPNIVIENVYRLYSKGT